MFSDLKVGTRLGLAFGAVLLLLALTLVTAISRMSVVNDHLHAITDENNVEARAAKEIRGDSFRIALTVRDLIITTDTTTLKSEREDLTTLTHGLDERIQQLDQLFNSLSSTSSTEKDLMRKIKELAPGLKAAAMGVADLGVMNKNEEATALLRKDFDPRYAEFQPLAVELGQFEDKLNVEAAAQFGADVTRMPRNGLRRRVA